MALKPLFKRVLFGLAEGAIKVGGSALLPGAWPIVERALKPVLERLEERFVGDVTKSMELAQQAVVEFDNDPRLQELWRGTLVEELQPLLASHAALNEDQQKLLLIVAGNREVLDQVLAGVERLEAGVGRVEASVDRIIDEGVKLSPETIQELTGGIVSIYQRMEQTRALARAQRRRGWMTQELIERQVTRIQARAVELIQAKEVDRAFDELGEGQMLLAALLEETPSDTGLILQQGYFYKTIGQAFCETGEQHQEQHYFDLALKTFELIRDEAPADAKTAADLAGAINGIGNVQAQRGDLRDAIKSYELATTLAPTYAYAWHDMFAAYDLLARRGEVELEPMRHALAAVMAHGQGLPGIGKAKIEQLQRILARHQGGAAAAGAGGAS